MVNNSIFDDLNKNTSNDQVVGNFGGIQNFTQRLQNFAQEFSRQTSMSPKEKVQEMLNSGQMSQSQFNQFRAMANKLTGKNL